VAAPTARPGVDMDPTGGKNLGYLFWAYTFIWILLAGYLLRLGSRLQRVRRDLDEMKREKTDGPPR
jgi:CcmD family protein